MKKIFLPILGIFGMMWACNSTPSNTYTVNGTTDLADGEMLKLICYVSDDSTFVDSCIVADGKFSFTGNVDKPMKGMLLHGESRYDNKQIRQIMVEPAVYTVELTGEDFSKSSVSGSPLTVQMDSLNNAISLIYVEMDTLRSQIMAAGEDTVKTKPLIEQYQGLYKKVNDTQVDFVKSHPASVISAVYMKGLKSNFSLDELKEIYNSWTPEVQGYDPSIGEYITAVESIQPGKPAPEISGKDQNDKDVTLSGLKGKVVLLDFWATWCGPCRASLPHVKEVYEKYNGKGLEVLAVSLDREKDPWVKYIAESGMGMDKYNNVFDEGGKNADKYAIQYIPSKFLIDAEGNLLGRFDEETELDAKLAEIFAEK